MNTITNVNNAQNSLQISKLGNVPEGNSTFQQPSLIKNITDDSIVLQVKLLGNNDYIETVLYPGWNVELITAIKGAVANQLQYGC